MELAPEAPPSKRTSFRHEMRRARLSLEEYSRLYSVISAEDRNLEAAANPNLFYKKDLNELMKLHGLPYKKDKEGMLKSLSEANLFNPFRGNSAPVDKAPPLSKIEIRTHIDGLEWLEDELCDVKLLGSEMLIEGKVVSITDRRSLLSDDGSKGGPLSITISSSAEDSSSSKEKDEASNPEKLQGFSLTGSLSSEFQTRDLLQL